MQPRVLLLPLIACVALLAHSAGRADPPPPSSCADAGSTFEQATVGETDYAFSSPGHVVEAEGISWLGIVHSALSLFGSEQGCWTGGLADGPYPDTSVYECIPIHCPVEGCPNPCFAYHTTECMAPEAAGGQAIEGFECAHYGDGISRGLASGDLVILHSHLRDLYDDAIEDDYGLSNTRVFDALIDGVHIAFGDRQRSSQDNDASATEWEVRESLIRVRGNQNPYKRRPGHGGFWKGDRIASHQHRYRITNNVFVAQGLKQGGLLFPVVGYVDECAGNTLLWAGPITGSGGWQEALADQSDFPDGLSDGQRLAALNAAFPDCFHVVLKAEGQTEAEFLDLPLLELGGKSWNQRVAEWASTNTAPGVVITAPSDGTTVAAGAAIDFAASASDDEQGDLSAAITWSSSLAGPLGSGASLTLSDLALGTHVVTASVTDAGGLAGSVFVSLTVEAPNTAPGVVITAPADDATFVAGAAIDFAASASDDEQGDLSAAITWSSSLAGPLGSGASLTLSDLPLGTHLVTASVTDAGGLAGSALVSLTVEAPNTAPGVVITAPADGTTVVAGAAIDFTATASDDEQGDLSAAIAWSSSLTGPLGSGVSLTLTDLAVGTHVVTASVTDAGGLAGSALVSLTVEAPNTAPGVVITAPADGTTFVAGAAIDFAASASDDEQGDLSAAIAWSSSLAGPLGSGASLTLTDLAVGTHVVTASVTDAGGLASSALVSLTVEAPNTAPGVVITSPADGTTFVAGAAIDFAASASDDEQGDLSAAIAWSSSLAGPLGSGASLTLTDLSVGTHVVTASVTDAGGLAGSAGVTLTVVPANTVPSCGIGPELALLIPLLGALRQRRRQI